MFMFFPCNIRNPPPPPPFLFYRFLEPNVHYWKMKVRARRVICLCVNITHITLGVASLRQEQTQLQLEGTVFTRNVRSEIRMNNL